MESRCCTWTERDTLTKRWRAERIRCLHPANAPQRLSDQQGPRVVCVCMCIIFTVYHAFLIYFSRPPWRLCLIPVTLFVLVVYSCFLFFKSFCITVVPRVKKYQVVCFTTFYLFTASDQSLPPDLLSPHVCFTVALHPSVLHFYIPLVADCTKLIYCA